MKRRGYLGDFDEVVLPHLDAAYNLARWLVRDPTTAEDIVREAFLRTLKDSASLPGGRARAWVLRIVHDVAYSHIDAQRPGMEIAINDDSQGRQTGPAEDAGSGMDVPDPGLGPETTLAHKQDLGQVDKAISALPVRLRECLVLRELEELSYKDIAQITDVPIETVMSRLSRAREALPRMAA
jgi:RNA polymerase sigma-70 factor (ECF subfamily)